MDRLWTAGQATGLGLCYDGPSLWLTKKFKEIEG